MASKRQRKNRLKTAEDIKENSGNNAPKSDKKRRKTADKKPPKRPPEPEFRNPGISRMVNQFVIDDEKQEKKDARRRSISKYNIFAKTEPRKRSTSGKADGYDFLGKNNDTYGDEYYDRSAMRKMQKKGKRKKLFTAKMLRRRKVITCGLLLVAIVFTCVVLSLTVLFRAEGYTVEGSTRYGDSEIIETCGIALGENIFIANKKAAEERLKNTFPYISEVTVRAGFPDKIKITITEGKQSYQVKYSKKKYCVVSAEGRILKHSSTKVKDLPMVKGVKLKSSSLGDYVEYSDEKAAKALEMIVTSIAKNSFNGLNEINIKNKANITLKYDGRIKIKLGLPEDVDYKIRTAIAIINEKLDPNHTGAIAGNLDVSTCNTTKQSYFNEEILQKKKKTKPTDPTDSTIIDADGDGIPDDQTVDYGAYNADYGTYTDNSFTDLDGDGIPDDTVTDNGTVTDSNSFTDADGDGIPDDPVTDYGTVTDSNSFTDADGDGIPDDTVTDNSTDAAVQLPADNTADIYTDGLM